MHPLKVGSHAQRILAHLARGKELTVMQAFRMLECCSLSSRIAELRRRGWDIRSTPHRLPSGKTVVRYSM